jgi:hypothetical protein
MFIPWSPTKSYQKWEKHPASIGSSVQSTDSPSESTGPHRVERPMMAGGHPHVMCLSHNVKVRFLGEIWGNGAGTYWKIWNPLIDYLRLSRLVSDVQHGKLYIRLTWETRKSICLTCFDSKIKWELIDGHAIHLDCYELLDICFAWLPDVLMKKSKVRFNL